MAAKTEKEKMMAGELYYSFGNELFKERQAARHLLRKYNHDLDPDDHEGRVALLQQLLGSMDMSDPPFIEPPFVCDYGYNITLGAGTYMNFGCCILDCNKVTIGARVLFGPNVQVRPSLLHTQQQLCLLYTLLSPLFRSCYPVHGTPKAHFAQHATAANVKLMTTSRQSTTQMVTLHTSSSSTSVAATCNVVNWDVCTYILACPVML
jgi:acetyltransferase-like isoleucine patch superfamily enzyme